MYTYWAEAAKEEEAEDDDDGMDGFQTDDEDDDGDGSDKEMGVDTEDGDEADSVRLQKLAEQVYFYLLLTLILWCVFYEIVTTYTFVPDF